MSSKSSVVILNVDCEARELELTGIAPVCDGAEMVADMLTLVMVERAGNLEQGVLKPIVSPLVVKALVGLVATPLWIGVAEKRVYLRWAVF